jgi:hypothetical protein
MTGKNRIAKLTNRRKSKNGKKGFAGGSNNLVEDVELEVSLEVEDSASSSCAVVGDCWSSEDASLTLFEFRGRGSMWDAEESRCKKASGLR